MAAKVKKQSQKQPQRKSQRQTKRRSRPGPRIFTRNWREKIGRLSTMSQMGAFMWDDIDLRLYGNPHDLGRADTLAEIEGYIRTSAKKDYPTSLILADAVSRFTGEELILFMDGLIKYLCNRAYKDLRSGAVGFDAAATDHVLIRMVPQLVAALRAEVPQLKKQLKRRA